MARLPKGIVVLSKKKFDRATYKNQHLSALIERGDECKCVMCGVEGTHVITHRHENEDVTARHNDVFALRKNEYVMLTIDHILPKSLGGGNKVSNYRIMCTKCNNKRANKLSPEEIAMIQENPTLYYKDM